MHPDTQTDDFYANLSVFRDFTTVMEPTLFEPLPDDWLVGVADVMHSTQAIAENRYKAVNMAGAAVIVAVTNALGGRDFPFVFGGDGASFAVPAKAAALARQALAETATWVQEDLGLKLRITWPPTGADLEARAARRAGESVGARKLKVLVWTLLHFFIMHFNIAVGRFMPAKYQREVIENSDFRKFDDSLRMVLDCTPALADEIEQHLRERAARGIVRFGTHRQEAAMMTCFTPSPSSANHVHFIDGALGGYAMAAAAMKAADG